MPLKDLPAEKLRNYGGSALTQADWGARLDTADWQVLDRVQTGGTDLAVAGAAARCGFWEPRCRCDSGARWHGRTSTPPS